MIYNADNANSLLFWCLAFACFTGLKLIQLTYIDNACSGVKLCRESMKHQ
jgi:hypothetical protein